MIRRMGTLTSVPASTTPATQRPVLEAIRTAVKELQGLKLKVVAGGTANANLTLTGIATADVLVAVLEPASDEAKQTLVAGAAAVTNIAVAGITTSDKLTAVWEQDGTSGLLTDRTSDASITSAGNIQLGVTNSTGNKLLVFWEQAAAEAVDRTSVATIHAADTVRVNADTSGKSLLVLYVDVA